MERYPADMNQAESIVYVDTQTALTKERVDEAAKMASIERLCILGLMGGVAGLIVLAWLNLTKLSFIAVAVIAGSIGGLTFLKMSALYPKFLPIVGVVAIVLSLGAAVWYFIQHSKVVVKLDDTTTKLDNTTTALTDVVKNVETIKGSMVEEPSKSALANVLDNQQTVTKILVAKVRSLL
jgi:hypothetical protein